MSGYRDLNARQARSCAYALGVAMGCKVALRDGTTDVSEMDRPFEMALRAFPQESVVCARALRAVADREGMTTVMFQVNTSDGGGFWYSVSSSESEGIPLIGVSFPPRRGPRPMANADFSGGMNVAQAKACAGALSVAMGCQVRIDDDATDVSQMDRSFGAALRSFPRESVIWARALRAVADREGLIAVNFAVNGADGGGFLYTVPCSRAQETHFVMVSFPPDAVSWT